MAHPAVSQAAARRWPWLPPAAALGVTVLAVLLAVVWRLAPHAGPPPHPWQSSEPNAPGVALSPAPAGAGSGARDGAAAADGRPDAVAFGDRATLSVLQPSVQTAPAAAPGAFSAARDGQDLAAGAVVRTDERGTALVTFFEGTSAELGPSSEIVIERLQPPAAGPPQVVLRQTAGHVVHRIAQALVPGAAYEVHTGSAVAVVRGTVLRVTLLADGGTRVETFRGLVDVTADTVTVQVAPGMLVEVEPGQPPAAPVVSAALPPPLDAPAAPAAASAAVEPAAAAAPLATSALSANQAPGPLAPASNTPSPESASAVSGQVGGAGVPPAASGNSAAELQGSGPPEPPPPSAATAGAPGTAGPTGTTGAAAPTSAGADLAAATATAEATPSPTPTAPVPPSPTPTAPAAGPAAGTPTPDPAAGTPTPEASGSASAAPTPAASATGEGSPVAGTCTVPNLVGLNTGGPAMQAWRDAGFSPSGLDRHEGSNYTVKSQSLAAGSPQPCTATITVHDHSG